MGTPFVKAFYRQGAKSAQGKSKSFITLKSGTNHPANPVHPANAFSLALLGALGALAV
jgi:hypothetical protein